MQNRLSAEGWQQIKALERLPGRARDTAGCRPPRSRTPGGFPAAGAGWRAELAALQDLRASKNRKNPKFKPPIRTVSQAQTRNANGAVPGYTAGRAAAAGFA